MASKSAKQKRLLELDMLRGLAIIMIVIVSIVWFVGMILIFYPIYPLILQWRERTQSQVS